MENKEAKNWNNFFLGLAIMILPFLRIPSGLRTTILIIAGFLVMLFSLARVGRLRRQYSPDVKDSI